MGVMRERYSEWPETVAFKRLIRSLVRAQQYIPPQQALGVAPTEGVAMSPSSTTEAEKPAEHFTMASVEADLVPLTQSEWTFGQNSAGDLVAKHASGHAFVIVANPEGERRG